MFGLKFNHINERGPRYIDSLRYTSTIRTVSGSYFVLLCDQWAVNFVYSTVGYHDTLQKIIRLQPNLLIFALPPVEHRLVWYITWVYVMLNTLRPRENGRRFADDTFKCIYLNENVWMSIEISPKFIPTVSINNIPALVQIMAWRLPGDKPLSEPMMVRLQTHICVTRPSLWCQNA